VDLDGFKEINETRGHLEGDRLLRAVGVALRHACRGGELCGRIGGDEFALVLGGGQREADEAARRLARVVRTAGVSATAAAGVLRRGERLQDLYRRTDEVLRSLKARRHLRAIPGGRIPAAHVIAATGGSHQGGRIELHLGNEQHSEV
jgi:diguanylate cyclase (GGDEF)-like protein